MELPMYQRHGCIILTITAVCSSSTGILIWEFPGEHPEVFEGVPSEGEGIRLVKKVWHIF